MELRRSRLEAPYVETSNGFFPPGRARARGASSGGRRRLRQIDPALARHLPAHRSHADPAAGPSARRLSVCVHRLRVRTVSSTLVEVGAGGVAMRYQPGPPCRGFPGVERTP